MIGGTQMKKGFRSFLAVCLIAVFCTQVPAVARNSDMTLTQAERQRAAQVMESRRLIWRA